MIGQQPQITIVDYGVGNVGSILNMLSKAGVSSQLSADPAVLLKAQRLILPGVGSFDTAASRLRKTGLRQTLLEAAEQGIPLLGVCLGMQLLLDSSEEGAESGLGLIPGTVRKFPGVVENQKMLVPHMGWNRVKVQNRADRIPSLGIGDRYYFVHSYYADPQDKRDVLGLTTYGVDFASAVRRDNVIGLQFHPEKSHRYGLRLFSEFGRN